LLLEKRHIFGRYLEIQPQILRQPSHGALPIEHHMSRVTPIRPTMDKHNRRKDIGTSISKQFIWVSGLLMVLRFSLVFIGMTVI